jgi:Predicted flavoprotein
MPDKIKILAISGSIRENSSNSILVHAISSLLPDEVEYIIYNEIATIPLFDDNNVTPPAVANFRNQINAADGIIICSPEYAFGVSGVLKNALDWTVSSGDFLDKPVAIITAALSGEKAHDSLLQICDALAAKVIEGATLRIPFIRTKINLHGEITDDTTIEEIRQVLNVFLSNMSQEIN